MASALDYRHHLTTEDVSDDVLPLGIMAASSGAQAMASPGRLASAARFLVAHPMVRATTIAIAAASVALFVFYVADIAPPTDPYPF